MVRETRLSPDMLILPLFAVGGSGVEQPIAALPRQSRQSPDVLATRARDAHRAGIPAVLLFGIPEAKDGAASGAYADDGVVQTAVRAIKDAAPDLVVVTDVCLCAYTDHGHCGVVVDGEVHNDRSLELIARTAVSHAAAGADVVAPSDMMDGRVGAIRAALDADGRTGTAILSYAVKYASAFYGPFREAAGSAPGFGDRRGYQMDPANVREARREVAQDVAEGADMVMVKPAAGYLDVISAVRATTDLPLAAYHVSGEYAMLVAAAERGWLDERDAALETLTAIRRAGADLIISYHAELAARWLSGS
jgi:porphobilinogen synthase